MSAGWEDFKRLLQGRFLFMLGTQMQAVALGWRMYDLTRDPLSLGFVGLAAAIPALSLALYAGYVVDRSRPLAVYRGVVLGCLASALVFWVFSIESLGWSAPAQVTALYVSSFITGVARGFAQPSLYATVPRLLAREQLSRASAWTASAMQLARISGPALGGILFGWAGVTWVSAAVSALVAIALASLSTIRAKVGPALPGGSAAKGPVSEELLSGLRFVFKHPILLPALSLDMISVFFGGVTALLPIYAAEILRTGPQGLGLLRAAPAIGAALTGLWLTRKDIRSQAGPWLLASVAGFGTSALLFGVSRSLWLSAFALGIGGAFDNISVVIRGTAVQLSSPDHMRGKISAVNAIFIGSSNELGEFESGVAARLLGTVSAVLFGGGACLLTVGVVAASSRALRRMDLGKLEAA